MEEACHKILVTSNSSPKDVADEEENIIIVDNDNVLEAITCCLEGPVRDLLDEWVVSLINEDETEEVSLIKTDIYNIRKQMLCEEFKADDVPVASNLKVQNIIPKDVKNYLLRYFYLEYVCLFVWFFFVYAALLRHAAIMRRGLIFTGNCICDVT